MASRPGGLPQPRTVEPTQAPEASNAQAAGEFDPEAPTINRAPAVESAAHEATPPLQTKESAEVEVTAEVSELPEDFEQLEFESGLDDAPAAPSKPISPSEADDEIDALLDAARPPSDFNPTPDYGAAPPVPPPTAQGPQPDITTSEPPEERDDASPFFEKNTRPAKVVAGDDDAARPVAASGPVLLGRASATVLPDERPAPAHLAEQGSRDAWHERATWFEQEASTSDDPQAKARLLLLASEMWAMLGDLERAKTTATQAHAAAPANAIASRQQRWLAAASGDLKSAVGVLEFETRASPSAEARVHAAYLSAEIQRVALGDAANAKKKFDLAVRAKPEDARAHLAKWIEDLAKGDHVKHAPNPDLTTLADLAEVVAEAVALRGGGATAESPALAFEEARRELAAGKPVSAAEQVLALTNIPELEGGALWLGAQLLAPDTAGRTKAIEALRRLAARGPDRAVERTLAQRALEQGDVESLRARLSSESAATTFTFGERVAMGALVGLSAQDMAEPLSELMKDASLSPVSAAVLALGDAPPDAAPGDAQIRSEVVLGQSIAALRTTAAGGPPGSVALRSAAEQFASAHPGHPMTRILELEFAVSDRDAGRVATQLADWPADAAQTTAERDRLLASGLAHEIGANPNAARTAYSGAFAVDSECEATIRALVDDAPPEQASALLAELAESVSDRSRAALLWCEAALRRGFAQADEYDAFLTHAADADPTIPFAARFGELAARAHGDADRLVKWLRVRRDASQDPIECSLDSVREALLIADSDMALAASLLADAIKARPADIGLRELYERLTTDSASDRGQWRMEAAEHVEGSAKLRLLLEAAREYERVGDMEGAARAALTALELGHNNYAELLFERIAPSSSLAPKLGERLLARARETEDAREQRELYERLSALDNARGDHSSALLWQSAILERSPGSLPALRLIEHTYISAGREDELEPIAATLARELDETESNGHAWLAGRLRTRSGNWSGSRDLVELVAKRENAPLWALRALSAHARAAGDDATSFEVDQRLSRVLTREADVATLLLRSAEASARLGRLDDARALIERACELVPDHLVAFTTRAEVLEALGDHVGAAEAYEKVADLSAVGSHQFGAWREAGTLWQDQVRELERAERALARANEIDPRDFDVFDRLRRLYVATEQRAKLAVLLERRLEQATDSEERLALEVTRARALVDLGDLAGARSALSAALEAAPDHAEALDAYADVCAADGDWSAAEQAWIRLARQVTEPERQAAVYSKLGELYDGALPNPERAQVAYNEVLKRKPDDLDTTRKLLQVYGKLGKGDEALALAQGLVERAANDAEKRDRTILVAEVLERVIGDKKKAEQTLEKARRTWAHDAEILRAQAAFYQRSGDERTRGMLLDRATNDSRRALGTGRFDAAFFRTIAVAASLRGAEDAAQVANATLGAIEGKDSALPGAGTGACDPSLDDALAPDLLTGALRSLLKKTGDALDGAYTLDTKAMRATPLPAEAAALSTELDQIARVFGLVGLEVYVSPVLGSVCMPLSSAPPRIVVGNSLLESDDVGVRTFLILRALKILQARAATLARTAPIELWPLVAGWLSVFAPGWTPPGVDAAKTKAARERIQGALLSGVDDDVPALALEIGGNIGNRASQLGTAVNQWGNRTALVALGDLTIALRAIAAAAGHGAPPAEGPDRLKWIVRNSEARDLAVFSVGDAYVEVRRRFGL